MENYQKLMEEVKTKLPILISNLCNKEQDEEKGYWELTEKLSSYIRLLCPGLRLTRYEGGLKGMIDQTKSSHFVGTVLIIAILTKNHQEHKDIWQKAVDKAEGYLLATTTTTTEAGNNREAIVNALKLFGL